MHDMTSEFDLNSMSKVLRALNPQDFFLYESSGPKKRLHASYRHYDFRAVLTRQGSQLSHYRVSYLLV